MRAKSSSKKLQVSCGVRDAGGQVEVLTLATLALDDSGNKVTYVSFFVMYDRRFPEGSKEHHLQAKL